MTAQKDQNAPRRPGRPRGKKSGTANREQLMDIALTLFARGEARRYHARTIARRVESYSGAEVPLRWLCNSVGMDTKDLAWYFENGYFANLSLDLNQKMVRRRTVPRHDPNRG